MEIAEEEEEEQRPPKRQSVGQEGEDGPKASEAPSTPIPPVTLNADLATSPEQSSFAAPTTSEVPNFVGVDDRPLSPPESVDAVPRESFQTDFSNYYPYGKPKVKIGPRPSVDSSGRPRTAGNYRPVSQIPAGFKLFGKGNKKSANKNNKDEEPATSPTKATFAADTILIPEEAPQEAPEEAPRPATSSGVSIVSSPLPPPPAMPSKPFISPEKARLMKAMKLREKRKKMAVQTAADASVAPATSPALSEDPSEGKIDEADEADVTVDSGIVLDTSASSMDTDHASTNSNPTSPIVASSEPDQSTQASSVSESTDETVQPKNEDTLGEDDDIEEGRTSDKQSIKESRNIENSPNTPEDRAENSDTEVVTPKSDGPDDVLDNEATNKENQSGNPVLNEPVAADKQTVETEQTAVPVSSPPLSIPESPLSSTIEPKTPEIPDTLETQHIQHTAVSNKAQEASSHSPPLKIPKSKFSTQDLRTEARGSPVPIITTPIDQIAQQNNPFFISEGTDEGDYRKQGSGPTANTADIKPPKRRAFIEPIRTNLDPPSRSGSRSDVNLSDDEELMEELQSATVQEAKPMLVAKSPVTPVFPSPIKGGNSPHIVRTASNPVRGTLLSPSDVNPTATRSISSGAAYLQKLAQQQAGRDLAKKPNVGSSISQRIKALEKLSSGSGDTLSPAVSRERPSSTFFSVRKGREPSRSPSVVDRANSFTRQANTPPSRSGSRDGPLENSWQIRRERSGSVTSRLSMFEPPMTEGSSPVNPPRGQPETIVVTAKIIRDHSPNPTKPFEPPKDPAEFSHLELKQSPLVVDHQKATPPPQWTPLAAETKETIQERRLSKESRRPESPDRGGKSRRSSLSVVKDFIKERRKSLTSPSSDALGAPPSSASSRSPTRPSSTQQNTSFTQRLSISSRRSSVSKDRENTMSPSAITEGSGSGDEKSNSDKKKSRAGRFMRRLSSLSSGGSRSKTGTPTALSPTVAEEEFFESKPTPPQTAAPATPSIISYMGDVNVQFPDNLLWKRRNMCLDSQGFLILSALPAQSGRPAQGTKRYHLSEFRQPYIPDMEVEELPNSVVLDLIEGSGVQVACEDRYGQKNILKSKLSNRLLSIFMWLTVD